MTAVETLPLSVETATEWGVRHDLAGHFGGVDGVEAREGEADARWWLRALLLCEDVEAVLVARVAGVPGAAWITQGGAA